MNSSQNLTQLNLESLTKLATSSTRNLIWIITCPIPIITNLLVVITIIFSKPLHNKSQFLIACHSIAECLLNVTFFCRALNWYILYQLGIPDTQTELICRLKWMAASSAEFSNCFLLVIALDRSLAIVWPVKYKTVNPKLYLLTYGCIILVYTLIVEGACFINTKADWFVAFCDMPGAYHPDMISYFQHEELVFTVSVFLIHIGIVVILWRKFKKAKFTDEMQKSDWIQKFELDAVKALATIGFVNGIALTGQRIIAVVNFYVNYKVILVAISISVFGVPNSGSHLFFYLWFNSTFRLEFLKLMRKCFRYDPNAVTPLH
jgi:hypothetical protein